MKIFNKDRNIIHNKIVVFDFINYKDFLYKYDKKIISPFFLTSITSKQLLFYSHLPLYYFYLYLYTKVYNFKTFHILTYFLHT